MVFIDILFLVCILSVFKSVVCFLVVVVLVFVGGIRVMMDFLIMLIRVIGLIVRFLV